MTLKCFFPISNDGFFWHINMVLLLSNLMSEEKSPKNEHIRKNNSQEFEQLNQTESKSEKKIHYPKGYLTRIPE